MTRIVVVTSGKGGVGKTTTSASFSAGLAMGPQDRCHRLRRRPAQPGPHHGLRTARVYDFVNVIQGEATLNQALIKDKQLENLFILPASQTRDKDALTQEGVEKVINDLKEMGFEYIVCDSPAGIETGALMAAYFADDAIVVTNPKSRPCATPTASWASLAAKSKRAVEGNEPVKEFLLLTRYNPKRVVDGEMLSLTDIEDILRIKLIGVIPESEAVLQAFNQGLPAIHLKDTDVSEAYRTSSPATCEDKALRFTDYEKPGFLKRLFGGKQCPSCRFCSVKENVRLRRQERLQIILAHEAVAIRPTTCRSCSRNSSP